jgi:hypothetical protein
LGLSPLQKPDSLYKWLSQIHLNRANAKRVIGCFIGEIALTQIIPQYKSDADKTACGPRKLFCEIIV